MLANILFPSTSAPPVFAEGLKFSRMLREGHTFRRFFGGTASAREPNWESLGRLEGLLTSDSCLLTLESIHNVDVKSIDILG